MSLVKAQNPFRFVTQVTLVELTGLQARNLQELLTHLRSVPGSVIYYHTHHFLLQHQYLSPEPPNDFAYWVTHVLNEDRLGEQLAAIDTVGMPSLRALRERMIELIERYVNSVKATHEAAEGEALHLMKSQSFVLPTPYQATDLAEFVAAVKKVSAHSLYHHIFESRLRLGKGNNDFSAWLGKELGEAKLAETISHLDPYTQTLEGLRSRIVALGAHRLQLLALEKPHETG